MILDFWCSALCCLLSNKYLVYRSLQNSLWIMYMDKLWKSAKKAFPTQLSAFKTGTSWCKSHFALLIFIRMNYIFHKGLIICLSNITRHLHNKNTPLCLYRSSVIGIIRPFVLCWILVTLRTPITLGTIELQLPRLVEQKGKLLPLWFQIPTAGLCLKSKIYIYIN